MEVNKILKVKVLDGGDITADGQPVTPEQLATKLAELKQVGGSVWYHRESPAGEPHPNAMKVIALVTANRLPIRLSALPDFSDAVGDDGVCHPAGSVLHLGCGPIAALAHGSGLQASALRVTDRDQWAQFPQAGQPLRCGGRDDLLRLQAGGPDSPGRMGRYRGACRGLSAALPHGDAAGPPAVLRFPWSRRRRWPDSSAATLVVS